jgi:hypothetical protein
MHIMEGRAALTRLATLEAHQRKPLAAAPTAGSRPSSFCCRATYDYWIDINNQFAPSIEDIYYSGHS